MTANIFHDVAHFHEFAAPYSEMSRFQSDVQLPPVKQVAHCLALVTEEYSELTEASVSRENLPKTADAYLDIMYVCSQGLLSLGLTPEECQTLWDEVHKANRSKVDPSMGLLGENEGRPYINPSGKIEKPPGFVPPDIEGLLNAFRRARRGG